MKRKLDYYCFVGNSGYGSAARYYIEAISPDFDVQVIPIKPGKIRHQPRTDTVNAYHCVPNFYHRFKRYRPSIGFATFENIQIPNNWISLLNENDTVITPSQFNYRSFSRVLDAPISYIPHCLDLDKWHPDVDPIGKTKYFDFLFFGTTKARKNLDFVLEAFKQEFSTEKNVRLRIKTDTQQIPEEYLPRFIRGVDCLINASLGEGFGLPGLQAMAVGTPVITTNWSGCSDYANNETAWTISPVKFEKIHRLDGTSQYQGLYWPVYSAQHLRRRMRQVLEQKELRGKKVEEGIDLVQKSFGYDAIRALWRSQPVFA